MALLRPWGTSLCSLKAWSIFLYFITYRIGAKVSFCTMSALLSISMMVGCTKVAAPKGLSTLPPYRTLPPCSLAALMAFS